MPRTYKRKVGARRYVDYHLEAVERAVKAVKRGMSINKAAEQFKIPRSTLQRKINKVQLKKPGGQTILAQDIEKMLADKIVTCADWGYPLDIYDIRYFVKSFLDRKGMTSRFKENLPGIDWAKAFIKRHKDLVSERMAQNIKRSRAKVSPDIINEYFDNLELTLASVPPCNIVNYDETNLSDNPGQKKFIFKRGCKYTERIMNSSKSSTSIMYAVSGDGTQLPVYVVYKALHMYDTWTHGGPKNARYNRSKSGWFDSVCFLDWFEKVVLPYMKKQVGKKVLLGDNLASHLSPQIVNLCEENDISFTFLPANSTHLTQPLDVAYFAPLKSHWRKILTDWKMGPGKNETSVPKDVFPALLKSLHEKLEPNQSANILAGFRKTGIIPTDRSQVLSKLPVEESVDNQEADSELVAFLRDLRYGAGETQKRRRRKKISVTPGKSVRSADFSSSEDEKSSDDGDDNGISEEDEVDVSEEENEPTTSGSHAGSKYSRTEINVNDFLKVKVESSKGLYQTFIANVVKKYNKSDYQVSFLRKKKENHYVFPSNIDLSDITLKDVMCRLEVPDIGRRGEYVFKNLKN